MMHSRGLWLIALVAVGGLAGCTTVQPLSQYGGAVPQPDRILVYNLAISPGQVELDGGIAERLKDATQGTPRTLEEMQVGEKVAVVLSEHLVAEIRDMGLPAQRAYGPPPPWGNTVMIKGTFLSIDEGNRTERLVIGLGAGRSDIRADVSVLQATPQGPQLLEQFEVDAKSGLKPGMAETMGFGAAAGHIATSAALSVGGAAASEAFGANVEADAQRAAKGIAKQLKPFFVSKGWIIAQ
jgi:Domain of unknown function (DUF4410)